MDKEPKTLGPETRSKLKEIKTYIDTQATLEYHKKFLEETGLEVGDIVMCSFSVSSGNSKQSYSSLTYAPAVLKQKESGELYCESIGLLRDSYNKSNQRSGRSYRSWWCYRDIHKQVGIGNIK